MPGDVPIRPTPRRALTPTFGVLLRAALLGAAVGGCAAPEPAPVEVGVAIPSADGGLMREARRAWQLVVDQINAEGGINDAALEVREQAAPLLDPNDLSPVADGFVDLANQGYKYIISLVSGDAVLPMMNAARPNGVLAMSITSEEPAAALPASDGLLLRAILPTDRLIRKQAQALQARGLLSIVVVGETVGGRPDGRQSAMLDAYRGCSGCLAAAVSYPAEADLYRYDWASVGAAVMANAPDVIFLTSTNVSALLDTIYWVERAGYTGSYQFAHGAFMAPVASGMLGSNVPARFRAHDLALPPSDELERFLRTYEARYGDSFVPEPRLLAFADYFALLALAMTRVGADDPHAVAAAMKELAAPPGARFGTLDYAAAADAVRAGHDVDFVGLSGPLDFDASGEVSDGFVQEYGVTPSGDIAALR